MKLYVCHCRECRKQTASAFGISAIVRREDFRLTQGDPEELGQGRRQRPPAASDVLSGLRHPRLA